MTNYARLYRFGITPWERYATEAAASITALLDREEAERSSPLGRALDLGCGSGQYTPELARRGWQAVGIDYVPAAIEAAAAKSRGVDGLSYVVGDVTRLPSTNLGTFDFFLDIGHHSLRQGKRNVLSCTMDATRRLREQNRTFCGRRTASRQRLLAGTEAAIRREGPLCPRRGR